MRWNAVALLALAFASLTRAAPLDELKSLSHLRDLDPAKLQQGEIISGRDEVPAFARGVYVESAYIVRAPADAFAEAVLHFDPSQHSELGVRTLREYRWPADPDVFDALSLQSSRREDRWLIDRTVALGKGKGPGDLHLTVAEADGFRAAFQRFGQNPTAQQIDTAVSDFWRGILRNRSEAAAKNLASVPSYRVGNIEIAAKAEFDAIIGMSSAVAAQFQPLISSAAPPDEQLLSYWSASDVRGHIGFQIGFVRARKTPHSWQVLDCTYYTSDTYFMAAVTHQLWPIENGTLVWQVDFVSAPFRAFTGGLDRVFAAREMIKQAQQTIKVLRATAEQRQ